MSQKNRKARKDNIPNSLAGQLVDTELFGLIQTHTSEQLLELRLLFRKWASQLGDYCERMEDQEPYEIGVEVNPRFNWTPESSN